ncbi:heterokaryon incompatibility protein [Microdochium trichocladiopsis]|uniref:Heterokaryon incompatibility protein n=1 Tax=Microdochium trichocladiopsis TaxID=1682393 RepID=A0A9P9BTV0_9PEZI|nr:heterokaryon incompatibility protein [Microdochium trichocladiopsis]KAH7035852.1 heterokaryon incompatibility protein [Microdochium trichocladiopsis]
MSPNLIIPFRIRGYNLRQENLIPKYIMLCSVCIDVLEHRKGSSALAACEICYPIWCQIDDTTRSRLREVDVQRTSQHKSTSRGPDDLLNPLEALDSHVSDCWILNVIKNTDKQSMDSDLLISVSFKAACVEEIPALKPVHGSYWIARGPGREKVKMTSFSSYSTDSEESWNRATTWIRRCKSSHSACNVETNAGPWFPTRLLDLAHPNAPLDTCRVVVTADLDLDQSERYMTLSHCWGTAKFLQLNKSSLADLGQGVNLDRLPKTFHEAIQVTRKLGVRFLWIDSLCIMQDRDDQSDWLLEAAQMHKVYSHSFCNISAARAVDSSDGLFSRRDPRLSHNSDVRICVEGLGVSAESDYVHGTIVDSNFWRCGVSKCPLNTRGWVLQERLLSPRVLHFARDQLFWECREQSAAECYPDSLPPPIRDDVLANFKGLDPAWRSNSSQTYGHASDDLAFYQRIWNSIVETYSATRLTFESDKLIALSGVARYFASLMDDVYVVGMWRKGLAAGLLWYIAEREQTYGTPPRRPEASVDGIVSYHRSGGTNLLFKVLNFHLDYVSADTTGPVTGGFLDLEGEIRPLEITANNNFGYQQLFLVVDGVTVKDPDSHRYASPVVHLDVGQQKFDVENSRKALHYMPAERQTSMNDYVSFLLLLAVDTSMTTFGRIGLAVTSNAVEIAMLSKAALYQAPEIQVADEGETELRTIRIV